MLFPFLFLAGALASGIFLASVLSAALYIPVVSFLVCLAAAWLAYLRKRHKLGCALAFPAALFLGWSRYALHDLDYERNPVHKLVLDSYSDFSGRLYRSPSFSVGRTHLFLRVEGIGGQGKDIKARGNLRGAILHPSAYPSPLTLRTGAKLPGPATVPT